MHTLLLLLLLALLLAMTARTAAGSLSYPTRVVDPGLGDWLLENTAAPAIVQQLDNRTLLLGNGLVNR